MRLPLKSRSAFLMPWSSVSCLHTCEPPCQFRAVQLPNVSVIALSKGACEARCCVASHTAVDAGETGAPDDWGSVWHAPCHCRDERAGIRPEETGAAEKPDQPLQVLPMTFTMYLNALRDPSFNESCC